MEASPKLVRVRIAPSPTGFFHVGNARTAIFNWLFARQHGGAFILRIEDTDKERSAREYEEDIYESLRWLGLDWDEGPVSQDGEIRNPKSEIRNEPQGFYRQSERTGIYKTYLQKLLDEGKAYYCFCSKEDLEARRASYEANGRAFAYGGTCRKLTPEEVSLRQAQGVKNVIRFKVSEERVEFKDEIRGRAEFDMSLLGDMVIAKDLETPLYNFSATVDDFEMEITHVIRGEDHFANTPKQILLQRALGFGTPLYAHLPLLLDAKRSKLSKRFGDASLRDYRLKGYLPEAMFNFLALLGWHPEHDREVLTREETVKEFQLKKVQKGGAIFNLEKLDWFNAHYIRHIEFERLMELARPFIPNAWFHNESLLQKALQVERERMRLLSDFREGADFFFELPDYAPELLIWKEVSLEKTRTYLEEMLTIMEESFGADAEEHLMKFANEKGRGEVLWPLRVALSGRRTSPSPFEIIQVLGREEATSRIRTAIDKISKF